MNGAYTRWVDVDRPGEHESIDKQLGWEAIRPQPSWVPRQCALGRPSPHSDPYLIDPVRKITDRNLHDRGAFSSPLPPTASRVVVVGSVPRCVVVIVTWRVVVTVGWRVVIIRVVTIRVRVV